jgi:deoxyadenosine/deoxycytidine kinase
VNTLISRVRKRGNPVEGNMDEEYLRRLSEAYTRYFHDYTDSPLLIVNSERLNFVDNPAHLDLLVERINAMRGGKEFFNRA